MPIDTARAKKHLHEFNFPALFVEELGWDKHKAQLSIPVDGQTFELSAVAEKRGLAAFVCACGNGTKIPDYNVRRKIERQVVKSAHEHFIVFTDEAKTTQIWQWVKREAGKPAACREHHFDRGQSGEALIQKLKNVGIELDEEENLTLVDVTIRARAGFDVEKVTKRFYERFQKEHGAFLKFIKGIPNDGLHRWYASVMLNRLMFIYFIQKKGFLNNDTNYLRNKLAASKPKDRYFTHFLCPLFFEGFAKKDTDRTAAVNQLLGQVPYLNGGLFLRHQIEELHGKTIQISDAAFQRIFDFFEAYQWHLDERPLRADNEINPDVLGYIFEKYINQKEMGAYYTKEDITEYISKNTVLPFLFDAARPKCKIAFENPNRPTIWDLLRADPNRYIYSAVRHGSEKSLPSNIASGISDVSKRADWNNAAPREFALATESWREAIARWQRYEDIRKTLGAGEVYDINDLITLNLDIRQFAQDVIENCEGPELLRAFWHAIENVTVLDPACGSGAFLFAALNVLEPLYEACLDRMAAFVEELDRSDQKYRPEKFSDFRKVLARVATHPNRRYFVFKSIILNNLFGVDIMEEATEICKLRLFLKLVAQIDRLDQIEPLPDIDFNIQAGNTLVGYATADEVRRCMQEFGSGQMRLGVEDELKSYARFAEKVEIAERLFHHFREMQTEQGMDAKDFVNAKQTLRHQLEVLEKELNAYLATDYGIKPEKRAEYLKWLKSHQPFHWFVEFYGIMSSGGFDVIIGNPPYVVNTAEKVGYDIKEGLFTTLPCKNLYAFFCERSIQLAHKNSYIGLIVQLTALSSEKMTPLQDLLLKRGVLIAPSFPRRPESIFDGVEMPVTILMSRHKAPEIFTSRIGRFYTEERPNALHVMQLTKHNLRLHGHRIGKVGTGLEINIFHKLNTATTPLDSLTTAASEHVLYYQEACRYWVKACKGYPYFRRNGKSMAPPHGRTVSFTSSAACAFAACLINSSLFYWFYSVFSDCEHINDALIRAFKLPGDWQKKDWRSLENHLARSLKQNSQRKTISTKQGHTIEYDELDASQSKPIIDDIDRVLAQHYGFTKEELDFIINYDIKYRMGLGGDSE